MFAGKVRRKNSPEVRPDFGLWENLVGQPFGRPEKMAGKLVGDWTEVRPEKWCGSLLGNNLGIYVCIYKKEGYR